MESKTLVSQQVSYIKGWCLVYTIVMSDALTLILTRIKSLQRSKWYTSAICEYELNHDDIGELEKLGLVVTVRHFCKKYPFMISWADQNNVYVF